MATDNLDQLAESLIISSEPAEETQDAPEVVEDEVEAVEAVEDEPEAEAEGEADEDPTDELTEDEAEDDAPATFTVKVDGKEEAVTLEDLTRSYSGQAYIQKGMQEAAAQKKEAESFLNTLQNAQAKYLEAAQSVQQQGFLPKPQEPDPAMAETDPIGYLQADANYRHEAAAYQAQQQQIQNITQQRTQLQEQARSEYLNQQRQILSQAIPELSDPVKGAELTAKLAKVGVDSYGFTQEEIGAVQDARHVQVLHDAMKWRELHAGKAEPKRPAPKTVKPKAKLPQPKQLARANALAQARKTGDDRDFAALLLQPEN